MILFINLLLQITNQHLSTESKFRYILFDKHQKQTQLVGLFR